MPSIELPMKTLPQMLREQAGIRGESTALRQKEFGIWKPTSWRDYFERARRVGHGLAALGVGPGAHVAVLSENRIEWVLAQLGAGLIGAVTVGVYPTSPSNEVAYVVGHSDAEIIVCEDQEQVDKVLDQRTELPRLVRIVVIETKGMRRYPNDIVMSFADLEALGHEHVNGHPTLVDERLSAQTLDDVGLIIYTSGSTGSPKGAMISYRNIRAQATALIERIDIDARTSHLSYLPLCHVAEQMLTTMGPLYSGAVVNFGESIRTVLEDLREIAPSIFLGVPRIWEKLHSAIHIKMTEAGPVRRALFRTAMWACGAQATIAPPRRNFIARTVFGLFYVVIFRALQNYIGLRKTRIAMTGAAPIPPKIVQFFRTLGVPLVEVYGLTETTGMVAGQTLERMVAACVGQGVVGAELNVGANGELLVRGDIVFAGYYKNDAATAIAIRDGWLHTGDVVQVVNGQYRVVDRIKDIIITAGGKNLSPSEIENTVKSSPFIKECIVIGEGRKFVSALIQIDAETVGKWAEENRVAYTNFKNLSEKPIVRELIGKEIDRANSQLAQVANIRQFHLLTKELDHDDDEVTATMKVRRSNIQRKYAVEIEGLYGGP